MASLCGVLQVWGAYGQAKLANVLFARELAVRLAKQVCVQLQDLAQHLRHFLYTGTMPCLQPCNSLPTDVLSGQDTRHCHYLLLSP